MRVSADFDESLPHRMPAIDAFLTPGRGNEIFGRESITVFAASPTHSGTA